MSVFGVPRDLVGLTVDGQEVHFLVELPLQGGGVSRYRYAAKVVGEQLAFDMVGGSASASSPLVFSLKRLP